jgi:hypothetical protein
MVTRRSVILWATLLAALALPQVVSSTGNPKPDELRSAMRKLWEDHVTWTRLYIVAAAANLPEKDATAQRLMQNQTDLGNAIKPYYGDEAGGKLTTLLTEHIKIATELIDAAQKGDNAI